MRSTFGESRLRELAVVGHANIDRFLRVHSLPDIDRTVPVYDGSEDLGGTAANISRSAASFGVRVRLVSAVGRGFPTRFLSQLRSEGVDLGGVRRAAGRSPTCYISVDDRGRQFTMIDQGVMETSRELPDPQSFVPSSHWVHLTTGPPDYLLRVAHAAQASATRVSFDPAQEIHYRWRKADLLTALSRSEILFGNAEEIRRAADLAGVGTSGGLVEKVPMVVITDGAKGAHAITRAGVFRVPAIRPKGGDHWVGAGDAFRGGFYAAWFQGQDLTGCLTAGVRAASRWIERGGPERRRAGRNPRAHLPRSDRRP